MPTQIAAPRGVFHSVPSLIDDAVHHQGILDKARSAALTRLGELRGPAMWKYATEACTELTAATSAYAAKLVNLGSSNKTLDMMTMDLRSLKNSDPHFEYIAASRVSSSPHLVSSQTQPSAWN